MVRGVTECQGVVIAGVTTDSADLLDRSTSGMFQTLSPLFVHRYTSVISRDQSSPEGYPREGDENGVRPAGSSGVAIGCVEWRRL